MLLEQHLFQFFGNLPYLPKAEMTKHLDDFDLIKALAISENWDESIRYRQKPEKGVTHFSMRSKPNRVEMSVSNFDLEEMREILIDFPVESAARNSTELDDYEDRVICHSKDFESFENRILTIFHKIRTWFEVNTRGIYVNLDFGFNLEFLKKLRLDKFGDFILSGDKKNHQIDSKRLTDIINGWKIGGGVQIQVETIGEFEGNSRMLRKGHVCEFSDSRWITGDMFLNRYDSLCGKLHKCQLNSDDFNQYFKKWIEKKKNNIMILECYLENELDVEKVLEGLETKEWNPKKRGRIFRCIGDETDTFIDLADGRDIYRSDGEIGTIHISADKKVIKFFCWIRKFPLKLSKDQCKTIIAGCKRKLRMCVWSEKKRMEMMKKIEEYQTDLRIINDQILREKQ